MMHRPTGYVFSFSKETFILELIILDYLITQELNTEISKPFHITCHNITTGRIEPALKNKKQLIKSHIVCNDCEHILSIIVDYGNPVEVVNISGTPDYTMKPWEYIIQFPNRI